jgi:type I restriction enzyme S subunit
MMIDKREIPTHWKVVDVSSIGRVETGTTPSKQNLSYYSNDFPFYKPTDLEAGYNVRIAKDNISHEGIKQARYLPENSILVTCIGATIGKTGFIRKAGASNQQINAIIPYESMNPNFIYYQVIGPEFQKLIRDNASATTLPILNKTKFQSLPFVIAPIGEQQQIVSKIEELFSEIDKGVEELKAAQEQLKVYRQAVLNSCIKESVLKTIESIIERIDQGWSPKCDNESSNDIDEWAVIKTTAVQQGNFFENENRKLPSHFEPKTQHELKAGDLLITRAGPRVRVGVCCLVKHTRPKLLNCDKVYRMKINANIALPEYIETVINSPN